MNTINSLKTASAIVIIFGIIVLLGAIPQTAILVHFLIDLIFWPIDSTPDLSSPAFNAIFGISGSITIAWGAMLWIISTQLYPKDKPLARKLILTSLTTWFILDCIASYIAGVPLNIILNIPFLLIFAIPLRNKPTEQPI